MAVDAPNPELVDFTRRLWVSGVLSIPLLLITMGPMLGLPFREWLGERPAHGEVAAISHDGAGVFAGLPQGFAAVRYHSLGAVELPAGIVATAWSEDGVVMGCGTSTCRSRACSSTPSRSCPSTARR